MNTRQYNYGRYCRIPPSKRLQYKYSVGFCETPTFVQAPSPVPLAPGAAERIFQGAPKGEALSPIEPDALKTLIFRVPSPLQPKTVSRVFVLNMALRGCICICVCLGRHGRCLAEAERRPKVQSMIDDIPEEKIRTIQTLEETVKYGVCCFKWDDQRTMPNGTVPNGTAVLDDTLPSLSPKPWQILELRMYG